MRSGFHRNGLAELTHLQGNVHSRLLIHLKFESGNRRRAKIALLHRHCIAPGRQARNGIVTAGCGGGHTRQVGSDVGDGNFGLGNEPAARVENHTGDAARPNLSQAHHGVKQGYQPESQKELFLSPQQANADLLNHNTSKLWLRWLR